MLKCISIRNPWASYVCPPNQYYGKAFTYHSKRYVLPKVVENRGPWGTGHIGPLLIHASKTYEHNAPKFLPIKAEEYAMGCIIGVVDFEGTVMDSDNAWYQKGSTGLIFSKNYTFETPVPFRGQLGLFEVPLELVQEEITKWQLWVAKNRKA